MTEDNFAIGFFLGVGSLALFILVTGMIVGFPYEMLDDFGDVICDMKSNETTDLKYDTYEKEGGELSQIKCKRVEQEQEYDGLIIEVGQ